MAVAAVLAIGLVVAAFVNLRMNDQDPVDVGGGAAPETGCRWRRA
ncbi:hypothetical protein ACFT2C_00620 [Promicromonospora sp. NPDC057138]